MINHFIKLTIFVIFLTIKKRKTILLIYVYL